MFAYEFVRRAFFIGIILALIIPCVGSNLVMRRQSMFGDTLSHISLAGVCAGLIIGISPTLTAVLFCIIASILLEFIRKYMKEQSELAIAIMMSLGIGLSGVLSGFVTSNTNLEGFLFGSIIAIDEFEFYLTIGIGIVVLLTFFILYKPLMFIAYNEEEATRYGLPVKRINIIFAILVAMSVSIASRTVGALIVSSLLVIPVACALQVAKSYRSCIFYSVFFGLLIVLLGLWISYSFNLRPGGTIVLVGIVILFIQFLMKRKHVK